jgi:hypothetical protein
MRFQAGMLAFACFMASPACAVAGADDQGWGGPGWYITGSASPAPASAAAPDYVLLEGPHKLQSDCLQIYEQLYSPIGTCRYLDAKPGAFAG